MFRLVRAGRWLALWLTLIAGAIALTIALSFILFPLFVRLDNLSAVSGVAPAALNHNYHQLMTYLLVPWVAPLHLADFPVSASGAQHFADVKRLFLLDLAVLVVALPITWHWLRELRRTRRRFLLRRPLILGMVAPVVVGFAMAVNFDAVFIGFHHLLFRNNDWLFDPAVDPIINVLPEDFFLVCFVIALVVAEAVMAWGVYLGRQDAKKPQT